MRPKRRILALDGGGIKGVLAASFLDTVESATGKRIADHFDLVAGTSTGGIIALGLGLGMSAREIVQFYVNHGPRIFAQPDHRIAKGRFGAWIGRLRGLGRRGRQFVWPKYDPDALHDALTTAFGPRSLGDSTLRLVIPAYHGDKDDLYVFKTRHHSRLQVDWRERAVDVALATAAAPTYFRAHVMPSGAPLIDGGIWANNPAGVAAVEARSVLGWKDDELYLLSLGCSEEVFDIPTSAGYKDLVLKTTELFMHGQSRASAGTAKLLCEHAEATPRYFRYQPTVPVGKFTIDRVEMIDRLRGLGATCARGALPVLQEYFLGKPAEPFTQSNPTPS
ncbi:patatin [Burkholderiales bacterium GJ-E10]|nr:patatin [Burkholderiales bacterium GJ-E10]